MSGGGGGGHFPSIETADCKTIVIRTQLASPNPAVIATLAVGDELTVVLIPPTGPVQAETRTGAIAGALLPVDIAQLIDCIVKGNQYKARVMSITGGNCQVQITKR